jgi:hypothetical protein
MTVRMPKIDTYSLCVKPPKICVTQQLKKLLISRETVGKLAIESLSSQTQRLEV